MCTRCEKRGLDCSLAFLTPAMASVRAKIAEPPQDQVPTLDPSLAPYSLDLNSLELLHHYTSFTYLTLGTVRNMNISEIVIPQMAMADRFLMLGMLSVSALHLAHLQPQRRAELVERASVCNSLALNHYQRHVSIDDPRVAHSALAFGRFMVSYMLAQSAISDSLVERIPSFDTAPHWFHVVRGLVILTVKAWTHLIDGPFGPLLTQTERPFQPERNPDDIHLLELHRMLDQSLEVSPDDEKAIRVCRDALEELRRVAGVPYSQCKTLGHLTVINIWPGSISSDYVILLHQRRPEALVILAHYCTLLKKVNSYWYLKGLGQKLLTEISRTLEPQWQPWIAWAVEAEVWD